MQQEGLHKEMNLRIFMLALMKIGESWKNGIGQKEVSVNGKTEQVLFLQIPLCIPPSLEMRILLSSGHRKGTSHMRIL